MITTFVQSRARVLRSAGVLVAAAALVAGCATGGKVFPGTQGRTAMSAFDAPLSPRERAEITAMQARIQTKLASGYVFKSVGTAASGTVHADGSFAGRLGPGDHVRISLVPIGEGGDHVVIGGSQSRAAMGGEPPACDDCGTNDGGNSTPSPTSPPPPPNFGTCSAAGGATWGNSYNGTFGCLGPGASRPMSCGLWKYLSPGRGQLLFGNGQSWAANWISDDGAGNCDFG